MHIHEYIGRGDAHSDSPLGWSGCPYVGERLTVVVSICPFGLAHCGLAALKRLSVGQPSL